MMGIEDEDKLDAYAKEVDNKLVKESVKKVKKLNKDVDFVYGISPEDEDVYIRNTEIYLAEKEAEERGIEIGEERGVVKTMLKYNATMEDIVKETGLSEEEILKIKESM